MEENKTNWICTCTGEEKSGDYARMKIWEFEDKRYQVDQCLEEEIKYLLSMGVRTIASCCGHKRVDGFIAVKKESIELMRELGYERYINPHYSDTEEFFKPKTR